MWPEPRHRTDPPSSHRHRLDNHPAPGPSAAAVDGKQLGLDGSAPREFKKLNAVPVLSAPLLTEPRHGREEREQQLMRPGGVVDAGQDAMEGGEVGVYLCDGLRICPSRGGRPAKHPRREIVDAIRYVVDTGCKWRVLPADFPCRRTVWGFMARWAAAGIVGQIRDHLAGRIRRDMGKDPRAVATVIGSQSVKAAETVSKTTLGYDAGKKINGRKRHLVVDTPGLPLMVIVTPADLHDAAAAKEVLFCLCLMHPEIAIVWADSVYAGELVDWAKQHLNLTRTGQPPQGHLRLRRTSPPLGRREVTRVDDAGPPACPPACPRLRTAHPALRDPDHLGRHHPHAPPSRTEGRRPPAGPGSPTSPPDLGLPRQQGPDQRAKDRVMADNPQGDASPERDAC